MSATQRLAVFLVVSLLTHGLIFMAMPAPGTNVRAPVFFHARLNLPAPVPARRPRPALPSSPALPAPFVAEASPVSAPVPEPAPAPAPAADTVAPQFAGQRAWRNRRPWSDFSADAGIALMQEADRRRNEEQSRLQMVGNLWMGMFQQLSAARAQAEGSCTLRRETAFRLDCDNDAVSALVESLNISAWANKLGALDLALVELRVVASDGSVRLQAVTPVVAPTEAPR